jgi:hypothetical protein
MSTIQIIIPDIPSIEGLSFRSTNLYRVSEITPKKTHEKGQPE